VPGFLLVVSGALQDDCPAIYQESRVHLAALESAMAFLGHEHFSYHVDVPSLISTGHDGKVSDAPPWAQANEVSSGFDAPGLDGPALQELSGPLDQARDLVCRHLTGESHVSPWELYPLDGRMCLEIRHAVPVNYTKPTDQV
jgi:hypothetical protein